MGKTLADLTRTQLDGLKIEMCPRMYPQWDLQMLFLALSATVSSMEIQTKIAISIRNMPPRSLMGLKTASILTQAFISQPESSPLASWARRSRRTSVRSSRTKASSSRRSFAGRPPSLPSFRSSSWRWRSRFCSSSDAVLALSVGAEIAGADFIKVMGKRAKPAAV